MAKVSNLTSYMGVDCSYREGSGDESEQIRRRVDPRTRREKLLPRWTDPQEYTGYRFRPQEDTTIAVSGQIRMGTCFFAACTGRRVCYEVRRYTIEIQRLQWPRPFLKITAPGLHVGNFRNSQEQRCSTSTPSYLSLIHISEPTRRTPIS